MKLEHIELNYEVKDTVGVHDQPGNRPYILIEDKGGQDVYFAIVFTGWEGLIDFAHKLLEEMKRKVPSYPKVESGKGANERI